MKHVMLDLETMSTMSNAAIVAIGAVVFDPDTGEMGKTFYCNVDLESCVARGLHIQGNTVMWWLERSEEARMALLSDRLPLDKALRQFSRYLQALGEVCVWGNGATFDNVIIANAYQAVGLERPWSYKNDRDVRTIEELGRQIQASQGIDDAAEKTERTGIHHHALDDAIHQARYVSKIWQALCRR
ncbi:MAG: 3'-5' exoribonuclease [Anaerolineae bacterium]|nr:3'-5' exoribonuclease [Anaerolineae bacterium]